MYKRRTASKKEMVRKDFTSLFSLLELEYGYSTIPKADFFVVCFFLGGGGGGFKMDPMGYIHYVL